MGLDIAGVDFAEESPHPDALEALVRAICSASVMDRTMMSCLGVLHETAPPQRTTTKPPVEQLLTQSPSQSELV